MRIQAGWNFRKGQARIEFIGVISVSARGDPKGNATLPGLISGPELLGSRSPIGYYIGAGYTRFRSSLSEPTAALPNATRWQMPGPRRSFKGSGRAFRYAAMGALPMSTSIFDTRKYESKSLGRRTSQICRLNEFVINRERLSSNRTSAPLVSKTPSNSAPGTAAALGHINLCLPLFGIVISPRRE